MESFVGNGNLIDLLTPINVDGFLSTCDGWGLLGEKNWDKVVIGLGETMAGAPLFVGFELVGSILVGSWSCSRSLTLDLSRIGVTGIGLGKKWEK